MHRPSDGSKLRTTPATAHLVLDSGVCMRLYPETQCTPHTEAVSLFVHCDSQQEVDTLWSKLTVNGGQESQCGWLRDRYGLSWQIVPEGMDQVFADPDPARAQRAMQAMLGMVKLDVAALRAAADGVAVG